jgi:hypothetical protein
MNDFLSVPDSPGEIAGGQQPSPSGKIAERYGKPERILGCTGRGPYGAISEIRHGIEAEIWMELDELESAINGTWALPREPATSSREDRLLPESSLLLLSVANESILLKLEGKGNGITGITEVTSTWLDLAAPTIAATYGRGFIIQITERSIRMSEQTPL